MSAEFMTPNYGTADADADKAFAADNTARKGRTNQPPSAPRAANRDIQRGIEARKMNASKKLWQPGLFYTI